MTTRTTGLDAALALDAVYYSHPLPQNMAVLTVMGAVFDRVYFPGVYMPKGDYDEKELQREIDRLRALPRRDRDTADVIGMLAFVRHARTLDGFCVFTGDGASAFPDPAPEQLEREVFYAICGPQRPGWQPILQSGHHKAIPGSDEHVSWPGDYHYLAGSLIESGKTGIPLLNDVRGLPIPGIDQATPRDNAKILSATRFFVQTEVVPVMDALRSSMSDPARPWYNRVTDHVRVVANLGASFLVMDPTAAIAKALAKYAGVLGAEVTARGDQRHNLRRSGLYYLLSLQRFHEKHGT
jgi:hypothetical protein